MKLKTVFFLFILSVATGFSSTPPINLYVDVNDPLPRKFSFSTRVGNTPVILVHCVTNDSYAYEDFGSGWSANLNYFIKDSDSSGVTVSGTLDAGTGIITYNALSNSFPTHGNFFAEVYLYKSSPSADKLTIAQGELVVSRSPSSGSIGSLNLYPRINWDVVTNIGTPPWHAGAEPAFLASVSYLITAEMTNWWTSAYNWGDHSTNSYLVNADITNAEARITIIEASTGTYAEAYGWGDHSTNGYLVTNSVTNVEGRVTIIEAWPTNEYSLGYEAYGWGDHALAGYLTVAASRYDSLDVGSLTNNLSTNISGLTYGTYTGSLTSVSYTGETALSRGHLYAWGFNKLNAAGTSTLSIGTESISRTSAGAETEYFYAGFTNGTLVLKLDGNGSSKSDVTNVYVKEMTNGTITVANEINVGNEICIGNQEVKSGGLLAYAGTASVAAVVVDVSTLQTQKVDQTDFNVLELQVGLNETSIVAVALGATNYANAVGLGATNFGLAIGLGATNYADTVGNAIGLGGTNFALAIGAGATNYADTVGNAVGLGATNYADTVGNAVGLGATNLALAIGAGGSNYTDTSVAYRVLITGETNEVDLTEAVLRIAPSSLTNSPMPRDEILDLYSSLAIGHLYGDTNSNPIIPGIGILSPDLPETWSRTIELDAGTNLVGNFATTNTTTTIRAGQYEVIFKAIKESGNSDIKLNVECCWTSNDGVSTQCFARGSDSEYINNSEILRYYSTAILSTNIVGTNIIRLVRAYIVREGGTAATVTLYGGTGYQTELKTPGSGEVEAFALSSDVEAGDAGNSNHTWAVGAGATSFVYTVAASLSNETIIGATIAGGDTFSVATNSRILEIVVATNSAGIDTNTSYTFASGTTQIYDNVEANYLKIGDFEVTNGLYNSWTNLVFVPRAITDFDFTDVTTFTNHNSAYNAFSITSVAPNAVAVIGEVRAASADEGKVFIITDADGSYARALTYTPASAKVFALGGCTIPVTETGLLYYFSNVTNPTSRQLTFAISGYLIVNDEAAGGFGDEAYLRTDGTSAMTGNINAGGNGLTNASLVETEVLQITGGTPSTGAVFVATGNDGTGTWTHKQSTSVRDTGFQTTNLLTHTIVCGFKPRKIHVFANDAGNGVYSDGWNHIDGTYNCLYMTDAGSILTIGKTARIQGSGGASDRWDIAAVTYLTNGIQFTASSAGTTTNDVTLVIDFFE